MDNLEILTNYFNTADVTVSIGTLVLDIFVTAILTSILGAVYVRFGNSLSYKKSLASSFVLLAVTTMLIITVVKSSLALSLGLVGALSIVRFRAAIKEPEELTYLFLAISIGLGIGAGQRYLTIAAFGTILVIIVIKSLLNRKSTVNSNLFINLTSRTPINLDEVVPILKEHTTYTSLNRFEESEGKSELLFLANFKDIKNLTEFKNRIREKYGNMEITFFEDKGLFN